MFGYGLAYPIPCQKDSLWNLGRSGHGLHVLNCRASSLVERLVSPRPPLLVGRKRTSCFIISFLPDQRKLKTKVLTLLRHGLGIG